VSKKNLALIFSLLVALTFARTQAANQPAITNSRSTAITQAIEKVSPAVAGINVTAIQEYVTSPFFDDPLWNMLFPDQIHRRRVKSLGSGFVISADGYVVTNAHVVEAAEEIVVTLIGGKEYKAVLIGIDNASDIALLKIDGKSFAYAKLGSSNDIIIGEWVIALGNPFGLFSINYKPTATIGIVSGNHLDFGRQQSGRVYQDMIQTDAAINTGNSGGPLVNANGEVIGINTFIFTGSQYSEGSIGIGFAIPVDRVKTIVAYLKKNIKTGFSVQNIDKFMANYLNLSSPSGVIVTRVETNSSAERAGLKVGDIITQVDGKKITNDEELRAVYQEGNRQTGDKIRIKYMRGNREAEIQLELE